MKQPRELYLLFDGDSYRDIHKDDISTYGPAVISFWREASPAYDKAVEAMREALEKIYKHETKPVNGLVFKNFASTTSQKALAALASARGEE